VACYPRHLQIQDYDFAQGESGWYFSSPTPELHVAKLFKCGKESQGIPSFTQGNSSTLGKQAKNGEPDYLCSVHFLRQRFHARREAPNGDE
jgi:hypothetical protein